MIEEAVVIVLMLQRHDLAIDELVDAREKLGDVFGDREVHDRFLGLNIVVASLSTLSHPRHSGDG